MFDTAKKGTACLTFAPDTFGAMLALALIGMKQSFSPAAAGSNLPSREAARSLEPQCFNR
jgi:hypothetical protein